MNDQMLMTRDQAQDAASVTSNELITHYDAKYRVAWCYMNASERPSFTPALLRDLNGWCDAMEAQQGKVAGQAIDYHVLASATPGVFNLGGDLALFRQHVLAQDHKGLMDYAVSCINALYRNMRHFQRDMTTISLVQGDALGGGFEATLSSDVVIAERGVHLGLPEILFNLFPGMGAYSLLSRRLDPARAKRLILSGRLYSAEELHEIGLVDLLAEPGDGEMAVYDHIRRENKQRNGIRAMRKVASYMDPIRYQELHDIAELWVQTAMQLEEKDLKMMERLVTRQLRKKGRAA